MKYLKTQKRILVLAVTVALAAVVGICFYAGIGGDDGSEANIAENGKKVKKNKKYGRKNRVYRIKNRKEASVATKIGQSSMRLDAGRKPTFDIDAEEETNLTEEYRKLLAAIRDALDVDDRKKLVLLAQKLQSRKDWPSGVPSVVKSAMLDALGWFGAACLPEIAGFFLDGDEEIHQSAVEKYEEAVSDPDLSDRERSKLLVLASKVITDPDAMESLLFELSNMRNSVAVDTIKQLMASGGEATQSVLKENIEFITGEEGLDTPEKLDEWLADNPDDECDEEFYGGASADD